MNLPSKPLRGGAAVTLSVLLAASVLSAMTPAHALDPAGVGPRDPGRVGLPAYYTDDSGVELQLCIDGTARCGLATLRSDGGGGPGVGVGPDGEGFYWTATTSLSGAGFDIDIEFAAEAAWLTRRQPMTFDRLRIRGHSDIGDLTVDTPYGAVTVTAEDPIEDRNINFTEDVGCVIAPCNFREMTTLPEAHITSWITANTPPRGYLGNAVTPQPANVAGDPATISVGLTSTDRWVVMGKLAPANRVSLPNVLNFGHVRSRVATRSVTMKNLGTTSRTIRRVTLTGDRTIRKGVVVDLQERPGTRGRGLVQGRSEIPAGSVEAFGGEADHHRQHRPTPCHGERRLGDGDQDTGRRSRSGVLQSVGPSAEVGSSR